MDEVTARPNPEQTIVSEPEKPGQQQGSPGAAKKGMPKKTLLLIITLFFAVFALIGLALSMQNQKPQVAEKIPQITPDPVQTVLSVSSAPTPLSTPSAYKTDVVINTGQNAVTSVQLELFYDPKVLTKVDINPGPFFVDPVVKLKTIDPVNGRITYAISVPDQQGVKNGILGQGIVATINFSVLPGQKQTPTYISFLPKTEVSAQDSPSSVLKSTVDAKFTLESVAPIVTPSPTPTGQ